jgi:hypothetical protein
MKDFCDNELQIDDIVIVTPKNYRGLVRAKVVKFTPKQVRLAYMNTWNYGSPGRYEEYLVYPGDCVKHPDQTKELKLTGPKY